MKKTITLLFLLSSYFAFAGWMPINGLNGRVRSMVMYNGNLIAAGDFTSPNHVAKYNGSTWQVMGDGIGNAATDKIYCLAVYNNILFAGGSFSQSGSSVACSNIAFYNASTDRWSPIGAGLAGEVRCLYNDGTYLLAGGTFSGRVAALDPFNAGSNPTNFTIKGPTTLTGEVNDIKKYNNEYYLTGRIFSSGTPYMLGKLTIAGSPAFSPLTFIASPSYGTSLEIYNNLLYIGGFFNYSSNFGIVSYNGSSASIFPYTLGSSNDTITDLYAFGGALYATGTFDRSTSANLTLNKFFKFVTGKPISSVDGGFTGGNTFCIINTGNYFVCGGDFTAASGGPASNIARSTGMTIGIDEPENLVIDHLVFPNPVVQSAIIRFTSKDYLKNASLLILDQQGRSISSIPTDRTGNDLIFEFTIDRTGLPAGIY
ncbi:MAG: hypothetical protein ACKOQ6_09040, partial [Bacteroidota bacterium]